MKARRFIGRGSDRSSDVPLQCLGPLGARPVGVFHSSSQSINLGSSTEYEA